MGSVLRAASALAAGILGVLGASAAVGSGELDPASLTPAGLVGDGASREAAVSANGRFVAFQSAATDLVAGDANGFTDIFVRDRRAGVTTRVSIDSAGVEANGTSGAPSISANGRWVVFWSSASNLTAGDANSRADVFLHDRKTGETRRISDTADGTAQGNDGAQLFGSSISSNGRWVAFHSRATNLVPNDTNAKFDVFLRDDRTGALTLVSADAGGAAGDGASDDASISASGRFVAYNSFATNLVPGDVNARADIFVFDRKTGTTRRASVDSAGAGADGNSYDAVVSSDGNVVAFYSGATNLVPGDTNGVDDAFVHDFRTGGTRRVSVNADGTEAAGDSFNPAITANGRVVVFCAGPAGGRLVPEDTNDQSDVYSYDLASGDLRLLSVDPLGQVGDGSSYIYAASLASNGRWLVLTSTSSNFAAGDANGAYDDFVLDPRR